MEINRQLWTAHGQLCGGTCPRRARTPRPGLPRSGTAILGLDTSVPPAYNSGERERGRQRGRSAGRRQESGPEWSQGNKELVVQVGTYLGPLPPSPRAAHGRGPGPPPSPRAASPPPPPPLLGPGPGAARGHPGARGRDGTRAGRGRQSRAGGCRWWVFYSRPPPAGSSPRLCLSPCGGVWCVRGSDISPSDLVI